MLHAAETDQAVAATCFLASAGIEFPTPQQAVAARLFARLCADIHVLSEGKIWKE